MAMESRISRRELGSLSGAAAAGLLWMPGAPKPASAEAATAVDLVEFGTIGGEMDCAKVRLYLLYEVSVNGHVLPSSSILHVHPSLPSLLELSTSNPAIV
jgi:hypothetical protein